MGALLGGFVSACSPAATVPPVAPVVVSDKPAAVIAPSEFAKQAHFVLLTKERDEKTKLLLAGTVQYQLQRAEKLFAAGFNQEAEDVVAGALLLLRHDDELISATRGRDRALLNAGHAAARAGNAGRAEALYELTLAVTQDAETKKDVEEHLAAISGWYETTAGETSLEQVGNQVRRELSRSVVDPRAEIFLNAQGSVISWMRAALSSRAGENKISSRKERELALEAYRAIRSGGPAMIALSARQGTPAGAISALEEADLEQALPPELRALLEATVADDLPEAWHALFRQLENLRSEGGSETRLPRYVADGAALWAAIQLYRSAPGDLQSAMPLSMVLVEFGMTEVASSLLAQNSTNDTSPEAINWSLSLIMRGLLELSRTDQLEAARRSFQEAKPLLARASAKNTRAPGLARAQALMAALEGRHGFVERSRHLLESSTKEEPHAASLQKLARLQEQAGDKEKALSSLKLAIRHAQSAGDLLEESRAEESVYRLLRGTRSKATAKDALTRSLKRVTVLRNMGLPSGQSAAVERHYARVLEYFGRSREVRAAYGRALDASRGNAMELEITLTDMARAAMTYGDLTLARLATEKALSLGLPEENSIYIALWLSLLEAELKEVPDGLAHQILTDAHDVSGWLRQLREWGKGRINSKELTAKAKGIPNKTEAEFYSALAGGRDPRLLGKVAESAAIDLIEVRIAQDLLARQKEPAPVAWPEGLELPGQ